MNYQSVSQALLDVIKIENIRNITHCATRLRVNVRNIDQIDTEKVEQIEGVLGNRVIRCKLFLARMSKESTIRLINYMSQKFLQLKVKKKILPKVKKDHFLER